MANGMPPQHSGRVEKHPGAPSPTKRGVMTRLKESNQKRRARKANKTGEMTLVEHLQELRRRIIVSLIALFIGSIVGFIWYQSAPFGMQPLGEILRGPYCDLPEEQRAVFTADGECRLLATKPFEMFILRIKVAALAGAVLSSPVWLYQIWGFITPGLYKNEKRGTFTFVALAVILFVTGAVLAYYVMVFGLEFLVGIGDEFGITALTGNEYYNFLLAFLVIFGVSFEVPLVIVMLNVVGLLEYHQVKDKRRYIIVGIMIFAAFMTPGGEPTSMIILSVAISILVELAFQFCRFNDKRRGRKRPDWMDLDDEQASGPIASASPISSDGGIGAVQPIEPAAPLNDFQAPAQNGGFNYQQPPANPPTANPGPRPNNGSNNGPNNGPYNGGPNGPAAGNAFDDVL